MGYRVTYGGLAQLARAPALQAGGHRFEPDILHQDCLSVGGYSPPCVSRENGIILHNAQCGFKIGFPQNEVLKGQRSKQTLAYVCEFMNKLAIVRFATKRCSSAG